MVLAGGTLLGAAKPRLPRPLNAPLWWPSHFVDFSCPTLVTIACPAHCQAANQVRSRKYVPLMPNEHLGTQPGQ